MCRKRTLCYVTTHLENIQRVTHGYVWKTYNELHKDMCRKLTLSYVRARFENIQRVTHGYV